MKINVVLVEPEIPQNTGNIARTCSATNSKLHLVKPLGFKLEDKYLKRAGLDYWDKLEIEEHESLQEFLEKYKDKKEKMLFVTTKAPQEYTHINYNEFDEIFLIFGKETKGLPEDLLKSNLDKCIRIPMANNIRSLNLSNSVAIVVYETLRQVTFNNLEQTSKYFN